MEILADPNALQAVTVQVIVLVSIRNAKIPVQDLVVSTLNAKLRITTQSVSALKAQRAILSSAVNAFQFNQKRFLLNPRILAILILVVLELSVKLKAPVLPAPARHLILEILTNLVARSASQIRNVLATNPVPTTVASTLALAFAA